MFNLPEGKACGYMIGVGKDETSPIESPEEAPGSVLRERSMRISLTTLFKEWFSVQPGSVTSCMEVIATVAVIDTVP